MDKKILLVDDAAFMRMLIKDALTKNGYTNILEAADGAIACDVYAAEKPDLVIMGYHHAQQDRYRGSQGH